MSVEPEPGPAENHLTVRVNCAISLDGRLAYAGGERARLSGRDDLTRVMRIRAAVDGILVGVGTVLTDDPSLRVHWELLGGAPGKSPTRIILDSQGRIPAEAKVLDGSIPTLVASADGCTREYPSHVQRFVGGSPRVDLEALLAHLHSLGMRSILVEGGGQVLASFLRAGLFDELTVFVAPLIIGGESAPRMVGGPDEPGAEGAVPLRRTATRPLDHGVLLTFSPG